MRKISALLMTLFMITSSCAQEGFSKGPVFKHFGPHATVQHKDKLDADTKLKVAFDVSKVATDQQANRAFDSVARFINMHVANGVAKNNIQIALVVHGKAGEDLLNNTVYTAKHGTSNPSAALVQALLGEQVNIYLCGQSATYHGIGKKDLIDNVQMSLSAMTAHALLSQQGYSLNPF
jgi:intracellular sulfur oxidation DsrE/DsrF family protein